MIIPAHLVVLGLKLAASRVAVKSVEAGIDMASRERARRSAADGTDPAEIEARGERTARRAKQAVHVARHLTRS